MATLRKERGSGFRSSSSVGWLVLAVAWFSAASQSSAQTPDRVGDSRVVPAGDTALAVAFEPGQTPSNEAAEETGDASPPDVDRARGIAEPDRGHPIGPPLFRDAGFSVEAGVTADRTVLRSRAVMFDRDLLAVPDIAQGKPFALNLFTDTTLAASVTDVTRRPGGPMVTGRVLDTDPPGHFVLLLNGDKVTGRIIAPGQGTYLVRSLGGRTIVIRQVDKGQFEPCTADEQQGLAPQPDPTHTVVASAQVCEDEDIDVLVVYTALARDAALALGTDINSLIQESAALTNLAFENSQVDTRINIVHTAEVDYDESADNHYEVLVNYSDGQLNDVRPLRDQYKADLVSLLVATNDQSCGSAYQPADLWMPRLEFLCYSINKVSCMNSVLVFPHEIGHNLGCAHDHDSCNVDEIIFPYSYGHWFRGDSGMTWGSVMSYIGTEIPYFSNPDVLFDGEPTGVSVGELRAANNALTINNTSPTIAKIRCGGPTDCNGNGVPDADDLATGTSADANGNAIADECEVRLFVKPSAPVGGDCRSWATACRDLWDALDKAALPWSGVTEIWVAAATYKPDRGTGDRTASFYLLSGVKIYGGFAGNETTLDARAGLFAQTVLSGDLAGDDGPDFTNRSDNSYQVVDAWSLDQTALLDGFTVSGGQADGAPPFNGPGGIRLYNCNATFSNITFRSNFSVGNGGAASVAGVLPSYPVLYNCTFAENRAHNGGAFASFINSEPAVMGCKFTENVADVWGGGAFTNGGHATFVDCVFASNSAVHGGGVAAGQGLSANSVTLLNSTFTRNHATQQGGAVWLGTVTATIENCVFYGNWMGTVYVSGSNPNARVVVIANSILWSNSTLAPLNGSSSEWFQVRNCLIENLNSTAFPGPGNISTEPRFVNVLGPDWTAGTVDDDFRLLGDSPAIDAGDNAFVSRHLDLAGRARLADADGDEEAPGVWATVDLGPFEFASGELCGGVTGLACADADEFCKLPTGGCCCEFHGVCTEYADACVAVWEPVCGCDGVTYGNACEAERAGMSINYLGACEAVCGRPGDPPCAAESFCEFPIGTCGDSPEGGLCKDTTDLTCPAEYAPVCGCDGTTYDNACSARLGHASVAYAEECWEPLAAEHPGASCPACAVADCTACASGACNNGQVSLCEVVAYGCAWMHGCNDDAPALTRAGYVWRNGECYCWGEQAQDWFPAGCGDGARQCTAQEQGLSGFVAGAGVASSDSGDASVRAKPARRRGDWEVIVDVAPPAGASAVAVDLHVPKGWKVVGIESGGGFDAVHGKIKWGPYFGNAERSVRAILRLSAGRDPSKPGRISGQRGVPNGTEAPPDLRGTVFIDGVSRTISAKE